MIGGHLSWNKLDCVEYRRYCFDCSLWM